MSDRKTPDDVIRNLIVGTANEVTWREVAKAWSVADIDFASAQVETVTRPVLRDGWRELLQRMRAERVDADHVETILATLRARELDSDWADGATPPVATTELDSTSESVKAALADAETLIDAGQSIGAVDRVYTALHGFLIEVCDQAGLDQDGDRPTITQLWKKLRTEHPAFNGGIPHVEHSDRLMSGIATGLDAIVPIRNHGSLAHPNQRLLQEPEARLAVNFAHSILNYVNGRLRVTN